jgi:hypothetical protein
VPFSTGGCWFSVPCGLGFPGSLHKEFWSVSYTFQLCALSWACEIPLKGLMFCFSRPPPTGHRAQVPGPPVVVTSASPVGRFSVLGC